MKNEYLKNLSKIEFVVTNACSGQCKHCSEGDHKLSSKPIDAQIAADAVRKVAAKYGIRTIYSKNVVTTTYFSCRHCYN